MKFKVGDKVRFVPDYYEGNIQYDLDASYQKCIDKIGVITKLHGTSIYPYSADFYGYSFLFTEDELKGV